MNSSIYSIPPDERPIRLQRFDAWRHTVAAIKAVQATPKLAVVDGRDGAGDGVVDGIGDGVGGLSKDMGRDTGRGGGRDGGRNSRGVVYLSEAGGVTKDRREAVRMFRNRYPVEVDRRRRSNS